MFFINKNDNSIKDDELNENQEDTKFSMFSRHKTEDELIRENYNNPVKKENKKKSNDNDLVDYNAKFLKDNQRNSVGNDFIKSIKTIVCFAIAIGIVVLLVPKLLHYDISHKKDYVDYVNEMVDKVIAYYNQDNIKCTTTTKDVYYFDINKSDDMFGEKYISPFIKNPLEGYVEFDVTGDSYTVYVSFTDGMFGFDRIEYSKLNESDVKLFTYLSLARHDEMTCNVPFVFSE